MSYEFDPVKSEANRAKHPIDFREATQLWLDESRIEIPARTIDEVRIMVVGKIGGKHWSAIITQREGRTRIVSVRRSRTEEVALYENQGKQVRP